MIKYIRDTEDQLDGATVKCHCNLMFPLSCLFLSHSSLLSFCSYQLLLQTSAVCHSGCWLD